MTGKIPQEWTQAAADTYTAKCVELGQPPLITWDAMETALASVLPLIVREIEERIKATEARASSRIMNDGSMLDYRQKARLETAHLLLGWLRAWARQYGVDMGET